MATRPALQQISISLSVERNAVTPATSVSAERCENDHRIVMEDILKQAGGPMAFNLQERIAPFHICITHQFAAHIRELHRALDKALVDIVDRWWSDTEANFPARMPLEPHEEELLCWVDGASSKYMRPFRERYGMWRTDYLIEKSSGGSERAKICEINSRIPFNGFWVVGMHATAARLLRGTNADSFVSPDDFEAVKRSIIGRFDRRAPMYHVPRQMARSRFAPASKLLARRNWNIIHDTKAFAASSQALYFIPECGLVDDCTQQLTGKDITQCTIELFQEEFSTMKMPVLRQLATCCTNDLRNVLLIHDKRILGIVREQLPNLVRRSILTEDESTLLEEGIIETILPGTPPMTRLLDESKHDTSLRNNYIIKPVRDAQCNDIRLGRNITQEEWLNLLTRLSGKPLRPSEDAYIVQRLVDHVWYDIVTHDEGGLVPKKYHLIGSHHVINSELDIFGPWRLGEEVYVGYKKTIVMCSVVRPDAMGVSETKEV